MSIDPTALQGVLSNFNEGFSKSLQEVIVPFQNLKTSLEGLNASFQNMKIDLNFAGNLSTTFTMTNQAEVGAAISKAITPDLIKIIDNKISAHINAGTTDTTGSAR